MSPELKRRRKEWVLKDREEMLKSLRVAQVEQGVGTPNWSWGTDFPEWWFDEH